MIRGVRMRVTIVVQFHLTSRNEVHAARLFPRPNCPFKCHVSTLIVGPFRFSKDAISQRVNLRAIRQVLTVVVFLIVRVGVVRDSLRVSRDLFKLSHVVVRYYGNAVDTQGLVPIAVALGRTRHVFNGSRQRAIRQRIVQVSRTRRAHPLLTRRRAITSRRWRLDRDLGHVNLGVDVSPRLNRLRALRRVTGFSGNRFFAYEHLMRAAQPTRVHVMRPLNHIIFRDLFQRNVSDLRKLLILLRVVVVGSQGGVGLQGHVARPAFRAILFGQEAVLVGAPSTLRYAIVVVMRLLIRKDALASFRRPSVNRRALGLIIANF